MEPEESLSAFAQKTRMTGKGALCVALIVTRYARKYGLPLEPKNLLADSGGQVAGLGKAAVQGILKEYGLNRVLAEEGGRTSRGSVANMECYVRFLNGLHQQGLALLPRIEGWWVERVREFFAAKPFVLKYDVSKSFECLIRDLMAQAEKRQKASNGSTIVGSMLQYLSGTMLEFIHGSVLPHHGANVADGVSGREGDFTIGDMVFHVTTSPSEALMRKCAKNLDQGRKPVILTFQRGIPAAELMAEQAGIDERMEIVDAVRFLAMNLHQMSHFRDAARRETLERFINRYNDIIAGCDTDAGFRIEMMK